MISITKTPWPADAHPHRGLPWVYNNKQFREWVQETVRNATEVKLPSLEEAIRIATELGYSIEVGDCPHTELEFADSEVHEGDVTVHVSCRQCGRSGSTIIESKDVQW